MQLNINEINTRIDNIPIPSVDAFANMNYILVKKLDGEMVKFDLFTYDHTRFEQDDPEYHTIYGVYLNSPTHLHEELFAEVTNIRPYNTPYFDGIIFTTNWFKELVATSNDNQVFSFRNSTSGDRFATGIIIDMSKVTFSDKLWFNLKAGNCYYQRFKPTPGLCGQFWFGYNYQSAEEDFVTSGPQSLLDVGNKMFDKGFELPDALYYKINITAPIGVKYFDFSKVPRENTIKLYLSQPATIKLGKILTDNVTIAYCCDEPPKIISDYFTQEELNDSGFVMQYLPYTVV